MFAPRTNLTVFQHLVGLTTQDVIITFHAHKLDCVNVLKNPSSMDSKCLETTV